MRETSGDRGTSFLEYLALGVLAAIVVGALVTAGVSGDVAAGAEQTICRIVNARDCARAAGPPQGDPSTPPMVAGDRPRVPAPAGIDRAANDLNQNLESSYNPTSGTWDLPGLTIGWWQSANALTAMLDHDLCAGKDTYAGRLARSTMALHAKAFTNKLNDDTGWWALAFIRAYDLTGDPKYLDIAKRNADKMWDTGHDGKFGGGLYWDDNHKYKNAITNELYIQIAAELHNRIPDDTKYLNNATENWNWFQRSGMINSAGLVNDGLDDSGHNNRGATFTYNQGVILSGLVDLYRATGDVGLLDQARKIADATVNSPELSPNGILTEPCFDSKCGEGDGATFKGAFVRGLAALNQTLPGKPYQAYLDRQAGSILRNDTDGHGQYGFDWGGPYKLHRGQGPALQASALDAVNAAKCAHPNTR